jgi:S1-C subfamily serine protease/SpoVK/Ycf46/Vps4 family AAA+-type ATPase
MAVPSTHRFLFGRSPRGADRRIWVLSGQIQDWFFHDMLRGCTSLRRSLELWALDSGVELCVCLDINGALDFSGNPDPIEAARLFEDQRPRRRARYGSAFRQRQEREASAGGEEEEEGTQTAADQARQAAGGGGQAISNVIMRLSAFLKQDQVSGLVYIEDICGLLGRLERTQGGASAVQELLEAVQRQWHVGISTSNLLVLPCLTPEDVSRMGAIFPRDRFRMVEWIDLGGPEAEEIQAALHRLSRRNGFQVEAPGAVSEQLCGAGNLRVALGKVARTVRAGKETVTLESVLGLPPVDERRVASIVAELEALVGLQDVKAIVARLQARAQSVRQQLAEGASELPSETLHMVFTGRPGTGKTLVAGIVARLFNALGLLESDRVLETMAGEIISSNRGETGENMRRLLNECRGGVLFLDEAHQLGDPASPQAKEAVAALVPLSWNMRHELVIILAGYADRMHELFKMDPGMDRRFRPDCRIHFHDYGFDELWTIFEGELARRGRRLSAQAAPMARTLLRMRMGRSSFGNAGGAVNLAATILERQADSPASGSPVVGPESLPPIVQRREQVLEQAMAELGGLLGLEPVQRRLRGIMEGLEYDLEELSCGGGTQLIQLHPGNMLFTGPPGTGKTTVGRLLGRLLYGLGCIQRMYCLEAGRASLVGAYQGHSAKAVQSVVEQARDGVLFIDEAYSLVQGPHDSFGCEARDELVRQVTLPDNSGTVFVLGGYRDELLTFVQGNPGMNRRFPNELAFPAFAPPDCSQLIRRHLEHADVRWEDGVLGCVEILAQEAIDTIGTGYGSAGWALGLVGGAIERMKSRVLASGLPVGDPGRRKLRIVDFPDASSSRSPHTSVTGVQASVEWVPEQDAVQLQTSRGTLRGASRSEAAKALHRCSYQILARSQEQDGQGRTGLGTGFFVTPDGLVATSCHVVAGSSDIFVLCGRGRSQRRARLVASDDELDLALLSVDVEVPREYLPLGESAGVEGLSELVVHGNAHVNPGEPGRVVTANVVRNDPQNARDIESDGAIEQGFSGGPAFFGDQGAVVAVVKGGYGPSATLLVRAEQLREMLHQLGYRFHEPVESSSSE